MAGQGLARRVPFYGRWVALYGRFLLWKVVPAESEEARRLAVRSRFPVLDRGASARDVPATRRDDIAGETSRIGGALQGGEAGDAMGSLQSTASLGFFWGIFWGWLLLGLLGLLGLATKSSCRNHDDSFFL